MNKLTGEEILKIVADNYTVDQFAYGEWGSATNNTFTPAQQEEIDRVNSERLAVEKLLPKRLDFATYEEYAKDPNVVLYNELPSSYILEREYTLKNLGLGEVDEVVQYGGQNQGSTWYSVKYFKDHDVYIRTDGYYQSYHGTEFYDGHGRVVIPQERKITVYESATDKIDL